VGNRAERLSDEVAQLGLSLDGSKVDAILDTTPLVLLERYRERTDVLPIEREGFFRPDEFFRKLTRGKKIGVSHITLWEMLDPTSKLGEHPNDSRPTLSKSARNAMYERLTLVKELGIAVVPVTQEIHETAMNMWFDSRQGRINPLSDSGLIDPIVAATAIVYGIPLYATNHKHFTPFIERYPLNLIPIRQDSGYLRLDL
jgi:predicted nucleic acid-binding protein